MLQMLFIAVSGSNLLDFLPGDDGIFFSYFLSGIRLVVEATAVNVRVSVNAAKQVTAPTTEACRKTEQNQCETICSMNAIWDPELI